MTGVIWVKPDRIADDVAFKPRGVCCSSSDMMWKASKEGISPNGIAEDGMFTSGVYIGLILERCERMAGDGMFTSEPCICLVWE
jgi:hypothetical protein